MSDAMTNTVGYKNPHAGPVYLEINDLNIKVELPSGKFIMDTQGNLINDPVFEPYCHPKGLMRVTSDAPVPLRMVPASARPGNRPTSAVTQAQAFVRNPATGTVQPVYAPAAAAQQPPPVNKNPIMGMTVEEARKRGLIGRKQILVPDDYGADETTGAPERGKKLPDIRVSIESPPLVRTTAPLRPEQMQVTTEGLTQQEAAVLTPQEIANRQMMQNNLVQASAAEPERFNPATVRPNLAQAPVRLIAPDEPVGIVGATEIVAPRAIAPIQPAQEQPARPASVVRTKVAPAKIKRARTVVVEDAPAAPPPVVQKVVAAAEPETVEEEAPAEEAPTEAVEEAAEAPAEQEGRFVCAADGKPFKFRSDLLRHVQRNYPDMAEQLMQPYPAP